MFESKNVYKYLGAIAVLGFASYYGNRVKQGMSNKDENDELIRKYLLNESPLYGMNKPKLWIHSKYEINARSFKNGNTTDLNQPYLHQTIKTIINHCGNDFNVCLIDDKTFSKLIPDWDVNLETLSEPFRSNFREVGMLQLLYIYGGIVLPNSFICMKNVAPLFRETMVGMPFFAEEINHTNSRGTFIPSMQIMGAQKACPVIQEIIGTLKLRNKSNHFTSEHKFSGHTSELLKAKIEENKAILVDGRAFGIKTANGKPILLDDLMGEDFLNIDCNAYGIIIPADEVLSRSKYQWLAYLSVNELMKTKMVLTKYLKASIVDSSDEYFSVTGGEVKSVTGI